MTDKRVFIFDFDGLLVDTEQVYRKGWRVAFDDAGLDMPDEELDTWVGKSIDYTRAAVERSFGAGVYERLYAKREEYVYGLIARGEVHAKPYALEALRALAQAGIPVGVVTFSLRRRVEAIADSLGMRPLISHIVASEDVTRRKPDPEPYLRMLEALDADACEAVAFEDSPTGREAAVAAGIEVYLVPDTSSSVAVPEGVRCEPDLSVVLRLIGPEGGSR